MFRMLCLWLAVLGATVAPAVARAERVTILTGGRTGVYYWAGLQICQEIRQEPALRRTRCLVRATRGSVHNVRALLDGNGDLAIAQADVIDAASNPAGSASKPARPPRIRSVALLHREPLAVVMHIGLRADSIEGLTKYRMALGAPESGHRMTGMAILRRLTGKAPDPTSLHDVGADRQTDAFCGAAVDVSFLVVGHPNDSIREMTTRCRASFYSFSRAEIAALTGTFRYYRAAEIPADTYSGLPGPVRTVSVPSVLIARATLNPAVVHNVLRALTRNLEGLRKSHWALAGIESLDLQGAAEILPLHPGAADYLEDRRGRAPR